MLGRKADERHDLFDMKDSESVVGEDDDGCWTILRGQIPAETADAAMGQFATLCGFGELPVSSQ